MRHIKTQMKETLIDLGYSGDKIHFEYPANSEYGDYSTNLALVVAKVKGIDPMEMAEKIIGDLEKDKFTKENFIKLEAVKPGFINFFLKDEYLVKQLDEIIKAGKRYGSTDIGKGKKVQVEFISANPTGPLTLANGRGGAFGDVLSNIMTLVNFDVEREYYINDAGNQIKTFGLSILAALNIIEEEEDFYQGEYVKDWAEKNKEQVGKFKDNPEELGRLAARDYLENHIKKSVESFGIKYDRFTSEYEDVRQKELVSKVLAAFKEKETTFEKEGALWFKTTEFDDEKDRVLLTSEQEPTYLLVDAGHYLETVKRGFKYKINILGADHHGYVKRIQAAAKVVGLDKSEVIIMQLVRITQDGHEVKMSKRKGMFALLDDLIKDVGRDVARWFFLTRAPETHIDIDLNLAREKSKNNPIYYVQYAFVRLSSIIEQTKNLQNLETKEPGKQEAQMFKSASVQKLTGAERQLVAYLLRWPELVTDVADNYQVHSLTTYAHELAEKIQKFYETSRVIDEGRVHTIRLSLARAAKQVLENILTTLGIDAPEQM